MYGSNDTLRRRGFLGTLLASASVGVAGLGLPSRSAAPDSFPAPAPENSEFDQWLGKIKGKHRQVFDAPSAHEGLPLAWARIFLLTNKSTGVDENEVTAVLVLRHSGIALGMESRLWEKYNFGELFELVPRDSTVKVTENPFWHPPENSLPVPGMGIDELLDSGVLICMCERAVTVNSRMAADSMKLDAAEVRKEWISGIFPGIQLVPSGVLAVNRTQERGCTYCFAG